MAGKEVTSPPPGQASESIPKQLAAPCQLLHWEKNPKNKKAHDK
jgi:hypothetical protein